MQLSKNQWNLSVALLALGLLAGCHRTTESAPVAAPVASKPVPNMLNAVISTAAVTDKTPALITATVTTAGGKPVANETVSFSTQLGNFGHNATIVTSQTDTGGHATALLSAGKVKGPGAVIVQYIDKQGNTKRVPLMFKTDGSQKQG